MKLYMLPGYGIAYRTLSRLLHKFDLHYAPVHGPVEPGGTYQRWCKWCGMGYVLSWRYGWSGFAKAGPASRGEAMKELEDLTQIAADLRDWPASRPTQRVLAGRIEALLPALEAALAPKYGPGTQEEIERLDGQVKELLTEIAALWQQMACTHPKAC